MIAAGRHVKVIAEQMGHSDGGGPVLKGEKSPRFAGAFRGADDGTRTHDLLHGKQTL